MMLYLLCFIQSFYSKSNITVTLHLRMICMVKVAIVWNEHLYWYWKNYNENSMFTYILNIKNKILLFIKLILSFCS